MSCSSNCGTCHQCTPKRGKTGATGGTGATGATGDAGPEAFMNATGALEVVADGDPLLFNETEFGSGIVKTGGLFTLGPAGTYLVYVSSQAGTEDPGAAFQIGAFQNGVLVPRGAFSCISNSGGWLGGSFIIVTAADGETLEIRNIIGSDAPTSFEEERLTIVRTGP